VVQEHPDGWQANGLRTVFRKCWHE